MAKKRGIGNIITDLEQQLNSDYNAFIGLVVDGLANDTNSPVDTGFFASSWKASTQRASPNDKKIAPWSTFGQGTRRGLIRPRFNIPSFNYKKQPTVYIGNTAEYAAAALESPKITNFVQGDISYLVKSAFQEKRIGRVFLATGSTSGSQGVGILSGRTTVSYQRI